MSETINPDGSLVLIEAVYYRYYKVGIEECNSVEEAIGFLDGGEDYGTLSSIGVFVDGEPHSWKYTGKPPTEQELETMRKSYAKAKAVPPPSERGNA